MRDQEIIGLQNAYLQICEGYCENNDVLQPRNRSENVEIDLFDVILEYLVAEGYADTNKAALAIMANMSEEWKQSIVEDQPSPAYATQGGQTYRDYNNDGKSASQIAREKRMREFELKRGAILRGV